MPIETVIIKEHHIICDGCKRDHRNEPNAILYVSLKEIKTDAKRLGWFIGRRIYCPKCTGLPHKKEIQ